MNYQDSSFLFKFIIQLVKYNDVNKSNDANNANDAYDAIVANDAKANDSNDANDTNDFLTWKHYMIVYITVKTIFYRWT